MVRGAARVAAGGVLWLTLMMTAGCDKLKTTLLGHGVAGASAATRELDLRVRPTILFEVFGERDDPRMVPIAVLDHGKPQAIHLSANGWRSFDRIYHRPGASYTLYQDGRPVGAVTVKQGMWSRPEAPVYTLPSCQNLVPMAAVTLESKVRAGITVEFLATSADLIPAAPGSPMDQRAATTLARDIGGRVADEARIPRRRLDSLDFHAMAVNTGATHDPTLVVSYVDPNAEEAAAHGDETAYVFAMADRSGPDYTTSYSESVNGPAAHAEYRRYVDHLDLNGDGTDEIFLEGWQYGGDTYPMIMRYNAGRWLEIFRGAASWCLDPAVSSSRD